MIADIVLSNSRAANTTNVTVLYQDIYIPVWQISLAIVVAVGICLFLVRLFARGKSDRDSA